MVYLLDLYLDLEGFLFLQTIGASKIDFNFNRRAAVIRTNCKAHNYRVKNRLSVYCRSHAEAGGRLYLYSTVKISQYLHHI